MESKSLQKMLDRRASFTARYPFFGTHAMRLELVEDTSAKTAYTDGKVIGFNPYFVEQLTGPQIDMVYAHEVLHVVLNHPWRRGDRDPDVWNQAGDHVINLTLIAERFDVIKGMLADRKFEGQSTEYVYGQLFRERKQDAAQDQQGGGKGQSNSGDSDSGESGTNSSSTSKQYGPSDVPTFQEAMRDGELGEVRDCVDDAGEIDEDAEAANNRAVTITSAMERKRGEMSGALMNQLQGRLESHVDWREALLNFFQGIGNDFDITWSKPNRRFIGGGDFFPSVKREGLEHLVLVVDSSSSMAKSEIHQAITETLDIAEEFGCRVTFMSCSTEIGPVQTWEPDAYPDDVADVQIGARGGTNFCPPFAYIDDMDEQPDALVYFTDGEGYFPAEPDYPVVWATMPDRRGWCVTPPFGHQIEVQLN